MFGESEDSGFNFWPVVSDLMLLIVLFMILIIGGLQAGYTAIESVSGDITHIQERQRVLALSLQESGYDVRVNGPVINVFEHGGSTPVIVFAMDPNNALLQRVYFSDRVLFSPDQYMLLPRGKEVLDRVGARISNQIQDIVEIQIHGHADTNKSARFRDNLELAAQRADEVFRFLSREVQIEPSKHLMSASSFGEYCPVGRRPGDVFDKETLLRANDTVEKMQRNRRVELLLSYRKVPILLNSGTLPTDRRRGN
jgi:outer membrane protein OmpA-like peptidoglycan-associated protein